MLDIYSLFYGSFYYCKDCEFEFNTLSQAKYQIEGCCCACGSYDIDYLPTSQIKQHIKRLKEELYAIKED